MRVEIEVNLCNEERPRSGADDCHTFSPVRPSDRPAESSPKQESHRRSSLFHGVAQRERLRSAARRTQQRKPRPNKACEDTDTSTFFESSRTAGNPSLTFFYLAGLNSLHRHYVCMDYSTVAISVFMTIIMY